LADVIINKESNTTGNKTDQESRVNTFIQTWRPRTHKLPPVLKNMISKAKKYGVKFIAPKPSEALQLQMPLWHHIGADPAERQINNNSKSTCLMQKHKVIIVGDAIKMIERLDSDEHIPLRGCGCLACIHDRDNLHCMHPYGNNTVQKIICSTCL
ncbi:hypothetical protein BT96DRAFT_824844, partial [Gymnopus androsaceus JB14]